MTPNLPKLLVHRRPTKEKVAIEMIARGAQIPMKRREGPLPKKRERLRPPKLKMGKLVKLHCYNYALSFSLWSRKRRAGRSVVSVR